LKSSENRVLRRIFETEREEVKEDLIKLHNEKLHDLYFSPNIIRMIKSKSMRWKHHVAYMGKIEICTVCWLEGKKSLGRSKHRLGINTKMNLKETWYKDEDWDLSELG
jgi:hypothetical protein